MGLLDNIRSGQGLVSEISGQPKGKKNGVPFPTYITFEDHDDGQSEAGGTCQPGAYTPILTMTVPAGVKYAWGSGAAAAPENQGYIYVFLQDGNGNELVGRLRVKQESQTGRNQRVVADLDSEALHGSKNDRTQQQPFPEQEQVPFVGRDSHMVVEFRPASDTAVTIDPTNTEFKIPATEYDLTQA